MSSKSLGKNRTKKKESLIYLFFSDMVCAFHSFQSSGKNSGGAQFFYDMNAKMGDDRGQKRKGGGDGGERKRLPPKPTGKLLINWFMTCSIN